ncbi:MAG: 50S ribosomal protein L6 [Elusimicrobia bacterium HGW-Elusimicrobia-1]|nr:MAG: 50S ribosomal protein L6 [Elusimicrobia bacterium HGW-Elusimicrobia-1]
MSRLAKKPVKIPEKVTATLKDNVLEVKGPLGTIKQPVPEGIKLIIGDDNTGSKGITLERVGSNTPKVRALHGLAAALVKNAVAGVTVGFSKDLEIHGVGFKALLEGGTLNMTLGFTHLVKVAIPEGIKVVVDPKQTSVTITGIDKYRVGQFAANIRKIRPPEPYKATGIRYKGEHIIKKAGKAAGAAGATAGK